MSSARSGDRMLDGIHHGVTFVGLFFFGWSGSARSTPW
jgi:hypothetical protein